MDAYKNFAVSIVATAPSPGLSGTTLTVTAGQGGRFPAPPFNATVWPSGVLPDPTNAEIVRVTAIATDTLTIVRAQEGTTARTIATGNLIAATITKKLLDDLGGSWLAPFTAPALSAFTWVNQGAATATEIAGRIILAAPAGTGENVRMLTQALPAAPYTATACLVPSILSQNYHAVGVCLRESGTGKILAAVTAFNTNHALRAYKWTTPTTFSTQVITVAPYVSPIWLQMARSGSTLTLSWSVDGYDWRPFHSESVTTFFTAGPDQVGVLANCGNATYTLGLSLLSWAVT